MKTHSLRSWSFCFLGIAAVLLSALPAKAIVTPIAYWHMGENDSNATPGTLVTNTINSINGGPLVFTTLTATYSTDVAPIPAVRADSALSINFTNSFARTNVLTTATDNFGIEAWVKPTLVNGVGRVIAYNGRTDTRGWGLLVDDQNKYAALYGGVVVIEGSFAQPNVWAHLALVQSNGIATLFINGSAVTNMATAPNTPSGGDAFALGTPPQSPTVFYVGLMDEVRVFTFASGQFQSSDLLINSGVPRATANAATFLTPNSSQLHGSVFPNGLTTTAQFLWGTTTNYGQQSGPIIVPPPGDLSSVAISNTLTGLSPGGYHYAIIVSNTAGTNISQDSSFFQGDFIPASVALTNLMNGSVVQTAAWGDYNSDGYLDLLICGNTGPPNYTPLTQLWRNNGDGTFSLTSTALPNVTSGCVAWGDYDNDTRLDIFIAGATATNVLAQVWRNIGGGEFSLDTNANFTGFNGGAVAWGDYDNDGRMDLLLAGANNAYPYEITQVWHNNGDGSFSNINANLPNIGSGVSVAWGDYDNDGRLDILLNGHSTEAGGYVTGVWRNNGDGTFSNVTTGLPPRYGPAAWGDYDNDGRLDLLVANNTNGFAYTELWHNNGNGTFSLNTNAGLPGTFYGPPTWGDFDGDGRLDVLITGTTNGSYNGATAQIWHNNGNGTFSQDTNVSFPGINLSSIALGDFNNDGRIDILFSGQDLTGTNPITQLWKNGILQSNTPPQTPTGLYASLSGTNIVFHWNPSSDLQTPTAALTYNLRIGYVLGAPSILAPTAFPNGFQTVPQRGNMQGALSWSFPVNLKSNYYWRVQAVDNAFMGSAYSALQSVQVLPALAQVGAVNAVPGDTNGDGVVDAGELSAILSHLPTNGTVGPANLDLALRNYFAAYPLVMSNVDGLGSSNILFTLPNSPDPNLSVQASSNLVDWNTLGPVNYGFIDTNAGTNLHHFYRLVFP